MRLTFKGVTLAIGSYDDPGLRAGGFQASGPSWYVADRPTGQVYALHLGGCVWLEMHVAQEAAISLGIRASFERERERYRKPQAQPEGRVVSFQRFTQMPRVRGCITLRPRERPLDWLRRVAEGPELPHGLLATTPEGFPVRDLGDNEAPPRRPMPTPITSGVPNGQVVDRKISELNERSCRIAWYLRSARVTPQGGVVWCCDYPANKETRAIVHLFPVDLRAEQEPSK